MPEGRPFIRLLGGFAVFVDGEPVADGAWRLRKARSLVKLAALSSDRHVHRERACELLWPDRDPAAAANNFHQALHHARRALGDAGSALELRDDVLTLDAAARVDIEDFEATIAEARAEADPERYAAALAEHGGQLLPEDRYEDWTTARREAITELQLAACGELAELCAAAGDHSGSIEAFQRALLIDPLHEAAHRGLMRAYTAAGRRQRALEQFHQLRQALRREYEDDPDAETRRLYRDLLRGASAAEDEPDDEQAEEPRPRAARANPNNLPLQLTSFVGRERELAELERLAGRARLLTVAGPGGCGKTRLAVEAGARALPAWPGGVWMVDLAPIADAALVTHAVADAIGVELPPAADAEVALAEAIGERRLLVVLDNCEHLVQRCAELAETLLRACSGLAILATSREPLHCAAEVVWRVPSLGLPDPDHGDDPAIVGNFEAVRLFCARAEAAAPGFELSAANAADVARLCFRLDGIPLAIELAAARVRLLSPGQIVERLDRSLDVLGAGTRTALTRQQTLLATVRWSEELLSEEERTVFRRLAPFAGSFALDAVEEVCAGDGIASGEILDLVGRLVDKSLVMAAQRPEGIRYRLLDTFRHFARQRLAEAGEVAALEHRHRNWCLSLAAQCGPETAFPQRRAALQRVELEIDNVRAALGTGLAHAPDEAAALAADLLRFWLDWGHIREGLRWLEAALASRPHRDALRARMLVTHGSVGFRARLHGGRSPSLEEASVLLRELDDPTGLAWALHLRAHIGVTSAAWATCAELGEESMALAEATADATLAASVRHLDGLAAYMQADYEVALEALQAARTLATSATDDAAPHFFPFVAALAALPEGPNGEIRYFFEDTVVQFRRVGARAAAGYIALTMAATARSMGDHTSARQAAEEALGIFRALEDPEGEAIALAAQGYHARSRGDPELAAEWLEESLALRRELGDRRQVDLGLCALGVAQARAGRSERGLALVEEAAARFERLDDRPGLAGVLHNLGMVLLDLGRLEEADAALERSNLLNRGVGIRRSAAWVDAIRSEIAARRGASERAEELRKEALQEFAVVGDRQGIAYCQEPLAAQLSGR